ncbi:hypothetical protein AUC71_08525 [Methyloceanibacter marginalis]|uniref:Uncharacterized protein n=1 Tax=Methyloceanibacter marginalis TaxID=1774971 RepID=A0A1E3WCV5_9HYPH|nr:hypothetical protein AUC71_08525 [Methyloceanibacter marginalis]
MPPTFPRTPTNSSFNPFKLYSDTTPIGDGEDAADSSQSLVVDVVDVPGGVLPAADNIELEPDRVNRLVARAAENFAYADQPVALGESGGEARLQLASYRPDEVERPRFLPNTTVMQKTLDEEDDLNEEEVANAETKIIEVGKGDNLMGVFVEAGTDKSLATAIVDSLDAVFGPEDLRPGQKLDFRLVPAHSDSGQMEPVRVSIFDKDGNHIVTAARNRDGDYLASTRPPTAKW